jgi:26S proteasome regulatory subunit N9
MDVSTGAIEHLEAMGALHPVLAEAHYDKMASLFSQKLWHQLTLAVLDFLAAASETQVTTADGTHSFLALYDQVVLPVDKKLNQLSLARIASAVANSLDDAEAAKAVMENLLEKKARLGPAATLYCEAKLHLLQLSLLSTTGQDPALLNLTKEMLENNSSVVSELLADGTESDAAIVSSAYYECAMTYRKVVGPPEAYYREAIRFLNYTPPDALVPKERLDLATDLSLAALTGEGVFNFGEILQLPILASLDTPEHGSWLVDLMKANARGDVTGFHAIANQYVTAIQAQPALASRAKTVEEKITLLALVNMIFERPSGERTLTFDEIAARIQLPVDSVELVVMRALSLGLIKGTMDQVDQTLLVHWVMPRVLDKTQMQNLSVRFSEWAVQVSKAKDYMVEQSPMLA